MCIVACRNRAPRGWIRDSNATGTCPPTPINDGMGRLAGAQYNAAGQMTQWGSESRQYNSMGQLTNITVSGQMNLNYTYPQPGQNNGKLVSDTDNLTGETVTYAYDSLNRLISAQTGSSWGQGLQYDGFGNITAKTALAGSVPTFSAAADPATNHYIGSLYDANGNPSDPYYNSIVFDTENRLTISGYGRMAYDAQNKRIWTCTTGGTGSWMPCTSPDTYYFYSPAGKLLAQFTPQYNVYTDTQRDNATLVMSGPTATRTYFGSRLVGNEDRIGSRGKYFPYGEDRAQTPPNGQVGFATYTRDGASSYYADQRYYSNGRFMTPDPYQASAGATDPQAWNRYAYTRNDPTNRYDPAGLSDCVPEYPETCATAGGGADGWPGNNPTLSDVCDPEDPNCGKPPVLLVTERTCSISLMYRSAGGTPGNHTDLVIRDESQNLFGIIEGGPTRHPRFPNPFGGNWGDLYGFVTSSNPNLRNRTEPLGGWGNPGTFVAGLSGPIGSSVCDLVDLLVTIALAYDEGAYKSNPYRPVPTRKSGTYNSNSFTYTLLWDIGLIGPGGFPAPPGWTPGWGLLVPGLN